jgi:hypothetical protein
VKWESQRGGLVEREQDDQGDWSEKEDEDQDRVDEQA